MDIRIHVGRRAVPLVAVGIVLFAAGGVAYATIQDSGGALTACRLNSNGQLRLIDPSASTGPLSRCTANETLVTWNQQGAAGPAGAPGKDGKDGKSPTVAQLAAGDAHCAAGGASLTDASGTVAYVCNGAKGADGRPGKDGAPFDGTFTSPNGQFKLTVSDGGINIVGPDSTVSLPAGGGIFIIGGDIETVANNSTTQVAHDETTSVGHDRTETIGNDEATTVGRDRTRTVGRNEAITITGNRTETVHQGETITVDANRSTNVGGDDLIRVSGGRSDHIGGQLDLRASAGASVVATSIALNGMSNCKPAARVNDQVNSTQILTGSTNVCIGG